MIKYEDVKDQSTEDYFYGNRFSIDAFNKKYTAIENETYVQSLKRVCDYVASVEETEELQKYWAERWFDEIYNDWWHPAGSIMQGAGCNKKISLSNCTTISMGTIDDKNEWDNLESIFKNTAYTVAKCAAYRQGLGLDGSRIRPAKMSILNSANESEGVVHWLGFIDSIGYKVGQKGRIPAMLFSLNIKHPDIKKFIQVKSDYTQIQNANISVQITNDFYEQVLVNGDWELTFEIPEIKAGSKVYIDEHSIDKDCEYELINGNKKWYYIAKKDRPLEKWSKTINSVELLELLAKCMTKNAEPGIQNIDIARKYSNSDYLYDPTHEYDSRILSTNACQPSWSPILTKYGIRPLSEVYIGERIWSQNGWVTVTNKWSNGIKKVYKYRTTAGVFYGTEDHRIVSNGTKIEVYESESIDILTGEYQSDVNIDIQDVVDGIVFGDGPVHKASNDLVYLNVGKDDYDYFDSEISTLIGKENGINDGYSYDVKTTIKSEDLDYTYNRSIPDRFLYGDRNKVCGFLRGLFTANGGMSGNRIALKASSYKVIEQVQLMLSSVGIRSYFTTNKAKVIQWKNGEYLSKQSYDVSITVDRDKFFHIIGFVQKYKNDKLENIVNTIGRADKPQKQTYDIVSSELISEEEVFHITVDGNNHTYWTGNCNVANCSEQYLSRESLCVLASLNAGRFSPNKPQYDQELSIIGPSVNRFLDNVNQCELVYKTYATPHQKMAIELLRRTGAGYTNLAGWLFKKNLEYGSLEGNEAVEDFTKYYNYYLYKSSIELGREKGSFGLFDHDKFEKSPFVQRMIEMGLIFDAMRNVTCSSIAPTGTLTLMFRDLCFSYGIEPAFGIYFWKRTRISGKYEYYFCVPAVVRDVFERTGYKIPINSDAIKDTWDGKYGKPIADFIDKHKELVGIKFKNATEIKPLDKLDMMSRVMKWIDSSISVTYMLPEGSDWKDVYNFILEAWKREVKSIAAFPDKKMYGIVSFINFKDLAFKLIREGVQIHNQNFTDEELTQLNIKTTENIDKYDAPKRKKELICDIYSTKIKGKLHTILIGLLGEDPYEVFVICGNVTKEEKGKIVKVKSGHYKLVNIDNKDIYEDISSTCDEHEDTITRMVSMSLRHGVSLEFVCDQLSKVKGDVNSFAKAIARILRKYQSITSVKGEICPNCSNESLIRSEGCVSCPCGFSKCG